MIFAGALIFGALLVITWVAVARYVGHLHSTHWVKSDSGKRYTPGGAAKKVYKWFKKQGSE